VEIVSVEVKAPPPRVGWTVAGLKEHAAPAGRPEQEKLTGTVEGFCGVTVSVTVPCPPALTVNAEGDAVRTKLGEEVML
jgi:hypothetical protein